MVGTGTGTAATAAPAWLFWLLLGAVLGQAGLVVGGVLRELDRAGIGRRGDGGER